MLIHLLSHWQVDSLKNRIVAKLHGTLGCNWEVNVHYIFSRGREECKTVRLGATARLLSSQHECPNFPSHRKLRNTINGWIRTQSDLRKIELPRDTGHREFCPKPDVNQPQLPGDCQNAIHIRCSEQRGMSRWCTWCATSGSVCNRVGAGERAMFKVLNYYCFWSS